MNKKPNILNFLVVLIALSLTSCVEEIDPSDLGVEDFKSRLVVNGLFSSDSSWEVEISKTTSAYDPDNEKDLITFATVEIYDQNNKFLYYLEHEANGIYKKEDSKPSPKRAYSIKVKAPGFNAITATSFVPEKSILEIKNFSIIENEEEEDVEVDFAIEDRSQLESYYLWEVIELDDDNEEGDGLGISQLSETWIDDLTNNPINLLNRNREFLGNGSFGDGTYQGSYSSMNGENKRVVKSGVVNMTSSETFKESDVFIEKVDPSIDDPVKLKDEEDDLDDGGEIIINDNGSGSKIVHNYELRVMTISKELYEYYSSLEEYYQRGFHNHSDETPFDFYSNVEDGMGIFAGFSESVIRF
ncbi:MAG: DUF4249 family protein [Bacteroidota bacterium]